MIQTLTMLRASGKIYAPSDVVRARYGIKTKAAFSHWVNDPTLGFPRPIVVRKRFYFLLSDVEAWEAASVRRFASRTDGEAQRKNGKTPGRPRTRPQEQSTQTP